MGLGGGPEYQMSLGGEPEYQMGDCSNDLVWGLICT